MISNQNTYVPQKSYAFFKKGVTYIYPHTTLTSLMGFYTKFTNEGKMTIRDAIVRRDFL